MIRLEQLAAEEGPRLRSIRLRALLDAPDAFGSTYEESVARPADRWSEQLRDLPTFVAVDDDIDVGIALYARKGFTPNGEVSTLPPPRDHIREHQRELRL